MEATAPFGKKREDSRQKREEMPDGRGKSEDGSNYKIPKRLCQ